METFIEAITSIAAFFRSEEIFFWTYIGILTLITFISYARDKYKSKKNIWRTPESTLLILAFIGGAIGAFLGMILCRHKIRKAKFYLTVPFLALIMISFIIIMYRDIVLFWI